MDIKTGVPLKNYTTMRLGGEARFMTSVTSADDVEKIYENAKKQNLPIFILGGGSNTIVSDEGFDGIVVLNRIRGFEVVDDNQSSVTIRVGSGEIWDEIIEKTVDMGLIGTETMSGIPGTVGAAPVQNIGAYGQELADVIVSLDAYDSETNKIVTLYPEECKFSYRHSIFRGEMSGRFCITSVTLKLYRAMPQPPFYSGLQRYLDEHIITIFTPRTIRDAVLAIRKDKLPDPRERPNTGSFFKNAIIEKWQFEELKNQYFDMPSYDMPDGHYKIPTGWLIEQTGLKGQLISGMRVHDKNALVLINESASNYADLADAREKIIQAVYDKFHILIEQEPLEI